MPFRCRVTTNSFHCLSTIIPVLSTIIPCPKYHYTYFKCREVPFYLLQVPFPFHLSRHRDIQYDVFLQYFFFLLLTYQFCVVFRYTFPRSFLVFFSLIVDLLRRLFFLGMSFANRRHPSCGARFAVRRFVVAMSTCGPWQLPRHLPRDMF